MTVPCHNDLLAANMLDDGTRVRLIDYEYAGNNDAAFELGNIWSEAALPPELLDVLVTAYYGRPRRAGRQGPALRRCCREVRLDAVGVHPGRQQPHGLRLLVVGDGEVSTAPSRSSSSAEFDALLHAARTPRSARPRRRPDVDPDG